MANNTTPKISKALRFKKDWFVACCETSGLELLDSSGSRYSDRLGWLWRNIILKKQ